MTPFHRFFLIAEGQQNGYPHYGSAKIHFSIQDPAELSFSNLFICSPLFSIHRTGVTALPKLEDGTKISFIMVPKVFPAFDKMIKEFATTNELWFSLGLTNLVVIENTDTAGLTDQIITHLRAQKNLVAYETWELYNHEIKVTEHPRVVIEHEDTSAISSAITLSPFLPLHLKFGVSEYIISINKFLTASKKFTPQYYKQHVDTIDVSKDLVNDLSFLYGDDSFSPTPALLRFLKVETSAEARKILSDPTAKKGREDLINDRNARLIQFNSSMSYVYSQAYAGTFPIFDHIGIIRRHSLLGVGTAISSLFELICQIEGCLFYLPFEHENYAIYESTIPSQDYFDFLIEPSLHKVSLWTDDPTRKAIINTTNPKKNKTTIEQDFFNRLAFFSGRLGFREYDFSATAAIQVLVEANSLQWHVINYTHEIIHNHVRLILNNLITPPSSMRQMNDEDFMSKYLLLLENAYKNKASLSINYKDYFILLLINYAVNSDYHGSLTKASDERLAEEIRTTSDDDKYCLPDSADLRELILSVYRDITEIFVHVIDFSYIYSKNIDTYVRSIWASWSTVMSVAGDLKQYVLRTLLVISLMEEGEATFRYDRCRIKFLSLLNVISAENENAFIFDRIKNLLEDKNEKDLRIRFYNCLVVSDLVRLFFVGKLEDSLDNGDPNRLESDSEDSNGKPILYNIETNSFEGEEILSKVRFLMDQLLRASSNESNTISDDQKERLAAWLLLSLSSYNTK